MAKTRLVAINGSAGAFTPISATQVTRRVEIIEDFSANAGVGQGLIYQFNDGSATPFVTPYAVAPQSEPIILGSPIPQNQARGLVVGTPPDKSGGYSIAATLLINIKSASATATIVRVNEFD